MINVNELADIEMQYAVVSSAEDITDEALALSDHPQPRRFMPNEAA